MYHSITFGEKNTWDDWHLIPKTRPLFHPPAVRTSFVQIPGSSKTLDLSTVLSGIPIYDNRTGSFEFYVENGFKPWAMLYSEILECLHGQRMRAILEDDPAYYYEGRFSVNDWKSDAQRSLVVIDYNVDPYKRNVVATDEPWIWDTFNFENGIIRYYNDRVVVGTLTISIVGYPMPVSPTITSSTAMKVTHKASGQADSTYSLKPGINELDDLVLQNGENFLTFTGNGTVSIRIVGGRL